MVPLHLMCPAPRLSYTVPRRERTMNHILKKAAAAAGLALTLGISATACNPPSSSSTPSAAQSIAAELKSNPALHQQLTAAEQQGVTRLENCYPNGRAMFGTVLAGNATLLTAAQVAESFHGMNLQRTLSRCLPGAHGHPVQQFDTCFSRREKAATPAAVSAAVKPYTDHPVKNHHLITAAASLATSQATVRAAA